FSYLRRRDAMKPSPPLAAHEAIDLASIGGAINTVYLDIACVATAERVRAKAPPAGPPAHSPPPSSPRSPALRPAQALTVQQRPQRQPDAPVTQNNGQRPAMRPRRRGSGNGAAPPERKPLLAVHGVAKSFVGRKVVRGVSLYVRKGEAVGLLGPNGAGKTTVFYMITGLVKADQGQIELHGCDVTQLAMGQRARACIGYLPQEASIFRGLT